VFGAETGTRAGTLVRRTGRAGRLVPRVALKAARSPTLAVARDLRRVQHGGVGEDRRTPDRTDELIAELRDRVRSLENQLRQERAANKENRRILAARTSRAPELPAAPEPGSTQPTRRCLRSWWRWWMY
jgi:hypothetical protein